MKVNLMSLKMCQIKVMYIITNINGNHNRYEKSPYCNSLCLCAKQYKDRLTEKRQWLSSIQVTTQVTVNGRRTVNLNHNGLVNSIA